MPASGVFVPLGKADRSDAVLAGAGVTAAGGAAALYGQSKRGQRLSEMRSAQDTHTMARRTLAEHGPKAEAKRKAAQAKYDEMMNIRTPKGYKPRGKTFMDDAARVLADRDLAAQAAEGYQRRVAETGKLVGEAKSRVKAPTRLRNVGLAVAGAGAAATGALAHAVERRRQAPKAKPVPAKPLKDYRAMVHDGIPANVSPNAGRDWLKANKDRA